MNKDRALTVVICSIAILFAIVVKIAPIYFFNTGKNCLKNKNYVCAYKNFKNSYNFDKKNKDYRYYYALTLTNLSPTTTVQKELFEISTSQYDDSARSLATIKVSAWRNNVMKNIGDNYIEQAPLDNGIVRWDSEQFPLKYIILNSNNINIPQYYFEEIGRAFNQWQSSTQFIKFTKSENISDSNIVINIAPIPNDICDGNMCKYVVGYTVPTIKSNILKKMTITLYSTDPQGNFFSDKELYNTILHEIGHALGIMGHSYSSDDLMYMSTQANNFYTPYRSSFQYLSSQDINTIKLLYRLIPTYTNTEKINTKGLVYAPIILGTSQKISSRKLKEAQNYIKNAPDLPNGYIDMAVAYTELNKHTDAIKALEKAFSLSKTNNEKYLVLYNLAAIYMNTNNLDKALDYANEAKKLNNSEEIEELITNIKHAKAANIKPFKL